MLVNVKEKRMKNIIVNFFNKYQLFFVIIFICIGCSKRNIQNDNSKLNTLVNEINSYVLRPVAYGILLSPYELAEHNRTSKIRNIHMVDSIYQINSGKTTLIHIKNNQTIISKPNEKYNSRTYIYHKDGRINETLRGSHQSDLYIYRGDGYLIQHGSGGELKKAKVKNKTFEWYNVKENRLEYTCIYNKNDKLVSFMRPGSKYAPGLEYTLEEYSWNNSKVESKTRIMKYKSGTPDSAFLKFEYDSLGLIKLVKSKNKYSESWTKTNYKSEIETDSTDITKITLFKGDDVVISVTYDKYGNWIEQVRPSRTIIRDIRYRKKRRR